MSDTIEIDAGGAGAPAEPVADSSKSDVERALAGAAAAASRWARTDTQHRAAVLRRIADRLDESIDPLVAAADAETALGSDRLRGEVTRTTGQLRMLGEVVERGIHLDAIVSEADAASARPDVRRMQRPVGPVAVFSASNFPFAFSVAGGDTGSALAAGCPVVVKAHEGHPRTSRLTTEVVRRALADAGAPAGLLTTVYGVQAGRALVLHPVTRAVGFTGSVAGGTALMKLAQTRPDPIPFFGELGSLNPVVVLGGAAASRPQELADGYAGSLTLGTGQFCTNPGLLFVPEDERLLEAIGAAVRTRAGSTMLTQRIYDQYRQLVADPVWSELSELGHGTSGDGRWAPAPEVRQVSLQTFARAREELARERFGPAGLVVTYREPDRLLALLPTLPGSLTGAVHAGAGDGELEQAGLVADALVDRVGRLIFNGWPTGVAVCWAMHHGGPWPASTAPDTTSVGATAIRRWGKPIAYQNFPDELLPRELQRANPTAAPRLTQPGGDARPES